MERQNPPTKYAEVWNRRTRALAEIAVSTLPSGPLDVLVVGCGTGEEAGTLAYYFEGCVIGIDIEEKFRLNPELSEPARLVMMNAEELGFGDAAFDVVYSFHALEHIAHPLAALKEMSRVLRQGGTYCIGVPNRSRLIGYVGAGEPLIKKIQWNVADAGMRLRGRWHNEDGAHAGLSRTELRNWCTDAFGPEIKDISEEYYRKLYRRAQTLISFITKSGLRNVIFPSVYFCGRKVAAPVSTIEAESR
jgi:ubiquinone/menaquinone biosynthesis C-methylase UbiE